MAKNCGCNEQPKNCGCGEKIDLLCTFYGGNLLMPLNIENGTDGNTVIKIINDYIQEVLVDIELQSTMIESVGNGAVIYKGLSDADAHQIKTMLQGSGIKITEQENTITISIDEDWIDNQGVIENIGEGAEVYKDRLSNISRLRSLKGTESINVTETPTEIEFSINEDWIDENVDYPVIESEDIGTGTSMRKDVNLKKIGVRTLESDSFIISYTEEGGVKINTPGGGSNSNDLYIDPTFIRPSNWLSKAELIDGIPTAKGTLNDPFLEFDEYLRRVIGETGGSNANGPYSRVNPKLNVRLQVLTNVETDKILEVNNCPIYFRNNSFINYIGLEEYAFNTERLWNIMPKTAGVLNRSIYCELRGEGGIVNKFHFGAVCHKTSVASTSSTVSCILNIVATESGLGFYEHTDSSTYTALTKEDNITPYLYAGEQAYGSTQAPTTPIIKFIGKNTINWGATINGTKLAVVSNTQSFIEVSSVGSVSCDLDSLNYLINARYIGYQKKLYTGLAGMTADELEILGSKNIYFKSHPGRNIFQLQNESTLSITNLSTLIDPQPAVGVNSVLKIGGESIFQIRSSFKEVGGGTAISFIESTGTGNTIRLNNYEQTSKNTYFVKGDNVNPVSIEFTNSNNNTVDIIKKNVTVLNIDTQGTFSSIQGKSINSGIDSYANNSDAITLGKLLPKMFYYNTTTTSITQVQ